MITSEMFMVFALHCPWEDRIFDIHLRLDIQRCRTPWIHMRMCAQHRNTTNSNGNQVCPAFFRTHWECTSFVRYEDITVDRPPTITKWSDDPRWDTGSVDHHQEMHGSCLTTLCYLLKSTFLPYMMSFELFTIVRRRKKHASRDFFLKSHGSEIESVQFIFPNGFDFGVAKWILFTMTRSLLDRWSKWEPLNVLQYFHDTHTWCFCTTSSENPITSALSTGFQFHNEFLLFIMNRWSES